jgi:hypothetical protein
MKSAKTIMMAIVLVLFIFSITLTNEATAAKCYKFYHSWYCLLEDNYDYKTWYWEYIQLNDEGGYFTNTGAYGLWNFWKGTFILRQHNGCQVMAAGKKNKGFFLCTDGQSPSGIYFPGCWVMKKVNCSVFDSE